MNLSAPTEAELRDNKKTGRGEKPKVQETSTTIVETPVNGTSGLKKKKSLDEEDLEVSDDEESDATYVPYRNSGISGKRGRGRPRKIRLS